MFGNGMSPIWQNVQTSQVLLPKIVRALLRDYLFIITMTKLHASNAQCLKSFESPYPALVEDNF